MQIIKFIFFGFCAYNVIIFSIGYYYGSQANKLEKQKAWLESLFLQSPTK
jgi:hypothetical protein